MSRSIFFRPGGQARQTHPNEPHERIVAIVSALRAGGL